MEKHNIVADIKRVAADLGKAPSRDAYVKPGVGKFGMRAIKRCFGSFSAALLAAGFEESTPRTKTVIKKFINSLMKHEERKDLGAKFNAEIMPFAGKYDRKDADICTLMVRADDHAQWVDPFCDWVFWQVAKRLQPDYLIFGGDTNDFWEISAFDKNPRRHMTLQSEINFVKSHFFAKAREVCPKAQVDWLLGNHEWRLFKYLASTAQGLASLDCLQFDKLFELAQYEINLVARPSFLNERRGLDFENYKIYGDGSYVVTHGTSTAKTHSFAELNKWGISGASGHIHHYQVQTVKDLVSQKTWTSLGAMCQLKSGEEYIPDLVRWNQGFLIVHIHRGIPIEEYVKVQGGFAQAGGVYYHRSQMPTAKAGGPPGK